MLLNAFKPILTKGSHCDSTRIPHILTKRYLRTPDIQSSHSTNPYFLVGPLTPAPITLGSSSFPMENSIPIPLLIKKVSKIPVPTKSQNGCETSFFWQAGPPQYVVFTRVSMPASW